MQKIKALFLSLCLVLMSFGLSFAALSTEQQAVVTATEGMISDFTAMMWGLVLLVTGGIVGVKLFKKFFFKAT